MRAERAAGEYGRKDREKRSPAPQLWAKPRKTAQRSAKRRFTKAQALAPPWRQSSAVVIDQGMRTCPKLTWDRYTVKKTAAKPKAKVTASQNPEMPKPAP